MQTQSLAIVFGVLLASAGLFLAVTGVLRRAPAMSLALLGVLAVPTGFLMWSAFGNHRPVDDFEVVEPLPRNDIPGTWSGEGGAVVFWPDGRVAYPDGGPDACSPRWQGAPVANQVDPGAKPGGRWVAVTMKGALHLLCERDWDPYNWDMKAALSKVDSSARSRK